ncbi:histidine phosphatase family protein [Schlegelella sp. S2-27]|uniref:Histidine phosphatase family protein n=1 Tax=Caldimonas mangrovi TaxID=2944811 RepID=A0ABT0YNK4_9BURK|nr:histidine phosphatase family protein [Caldimonas mangrovi]MCM5680305.1 histidine phosphatase family protein [Caldimonas mangrovi]
MDLVIWRHPRPAGIAGRCIGRTDVSVDRRKAKRLAHAVRREARRQRWPREVWTSTLCRCTAVGEMLAAWGWRHHRDARLNELDFGAWDGAVWDDIGAAAVQAWCEDFTAHAPGGGESLTALSSRCQAFLEAQGPLSAPLLIVGHAGWMQAARLLCEHGEPPHDAAQWPVPPRYGESWRLRPGAASLA